MSIYSLNYTSPSAEDEFFRAHDLGIARAVVASLPSQLAELFQLHVVEGVPSRLIAEKWNVPRAAVYKATQQMERLIWEERRRMSA
jgi:DNA-directed RNA polymerase specialized sigma24 family protein